MDINSKLSITFSPTDAEVLFKKAILDYLQDQYGISNDGKNVKINFKATMEYGPMDRGSGSPTFNGVEVTIQQDAPKVAPKLGNTAFSVHHVQPFPPLGKDRSR